MRVSDVFFRYVCLVWGVELTANSPISTSSIPAASSSSVARSLKAGMKRPMKSRAPRMRQVPRKEYAPPVKESASW